MLSNNDGCIIARSDEAKALGFAMGDPYHLNHEKLTAHGVVVFSSNYALYGDMSRRVMETLGTFTPEIELYSIDEAFLNLAGFERRGLTDYARLIRATVQARYGHPGIDRHRPDQDAGEDRQPPGQGAARDRRGLDLADMDVDAALAGIEVGEVWGVGPTLGEVAGSTGDCHGIRSEAGRPESDPPEDDRGGRAPGLRAERPALPAAGAGRAAAARPHGVPLVRADR